MTKNLAEFLMMLLGIVWTRIVLRYDLVLLSSLLKRWFSDLLDSFRRSPLFPMQLHNGIQFSGVLPETLKPFQRLLYFLSKGSFLCFLSQGKLNHSKQVLIFLLKSFEALLFPNLVLIYLYWNSGWHSFRRRLLLCLIKVWAMGSHA